MEPSRVFIIDGFAHAQSPVLPMQPSAIRLADYQPPAWLVNETRLTFRLHPTATRVSRNPLTPELTATGERRYSRSSRMY